MDVLGGERLTQDLLQVNDSFVCLLTLTRNKHNACIMFLLIRIRAL